MGRRVGRRAAVLLTLFLLFSVRYGLYFSSSPPLPQFFSLLRIDSFGLLFPSTLFFHSNFFSQTRDLPLSRILCGSLYFLSFFSISRVLQFPVFLHYVVKSFNFPMHKRNNPIPARTHTSRVPVYSPPPSYSPSLLPLLPSFAPFSSSSLAGKEGENSIELTFI